MVFYTAFNIISVISQRQLTYPCIFWDSPDLGWGSKVSSQRILQMINPEGPVWPEPSPSQLQVKHFTKPHTKPTYSGTLEKTREPHAGMPVSALVCRNLIFCITCK